MPSFKHDRASNRVRLLVMLLGAFLAFAVPAGAAAAEFGVKASAAILIDADTGQVLFSHNADEQRQPASITKVMTLLLAMEAIDSGKATLDEKVRISHHAWMMGGSQLYLAEGTSFTLRQMMEAVAIPSANDAAMAVAEHLGGTEAAFVNQMNAKAKALGMSNTSFTNPTGLPPDAGEKPDLTTARDISIMARALINNHPDVLQWTSQQKLEFKDPYIVRYNTNKLLGNYPGIDGLKTGETDAAGWCLVGTAKRAGIRLISVVLGADSDNGRDEQTARLLDFGFNRFAPVQVVEAGKSPGKMELKDASPQHFAVTAPQGLHVLVEKGEETTVVPKLVPSPDLKLPIKKGTVVGTLQAVVAGQPVVSTPVVAAEDVGRANFIVRFFRWLEALFSGLIHGGHS